MSRLRVVVLAGGRSSEHDVSLASARSVVAALDASRYDVETITISRDGHWELPRELSGRELEAGAPTALPVVTGDVPSLRDTDVVLPILHGPFGEDGTVQGLLELAGLPYVGSGVAASALCMDKDLCKAVLRDRGVPVARSVTLRASEPIICTLPFPVFVKPARLGSSIGISRVAEPADLARAVELARAHDDKVLIEECLVGVEVECSVLGNDDPIASSVGEIVVHREWYDYAAKYEPGGMELLVPARIDEQASRRVQELAVEAFRATGCEGLARVDFFVRHDGEVLVNEVNTMPGFTETSVFTRLFEADGLSYEAILDRLIELALTRHRRRLELRF